MKRVMVNLEDTTAGLLETRAASDKRSLSAYVGLLVEKDLISAGLLEAPAKDALLRAELIATAEELGLPAAIEQLRKKLRSAKPAA